MWRREPDPPEALAAMPRLALSDLDRVASRTDTQIACDGRLVTHELTANGIDYVKVGFSIAHVEPELRGLLPLLLTAVALSFRGPQLHDGRRQIQQGR